MKVYVYFLLLLFVIILIFRNLKVNNKYSPFKIKILCGCVLIGMLLRYISLFFMLIAQNITYLYLLKPVYFLNLVFIPITALIIIYILIRSDKFNFSYSFLISAVLGALYIVLILKFSSIVSIDCCYGYFMQFVNAEYVYVGYMIIFVIFIAFTINAYSKIMYKIEKLFFIVASCVLILEYLLMLIDKSIFNTTVISDALWMVALSYSLNKLSKLKKTR